LLEHNAAVAVDGDVDPTVAPELGAVEVDLHDLALGGPRRRSPVVDPKVERRSEDEDAVGLGQRELPRA
jgi:hypothetical protein